MSDQLYRTIAFVAAGMLLVALLPMPYGYYRLLRLAVTAAACVGVYRASEQDKSLWQVGFGMTALLFNPVLPVGLTREIWMPINVIVAAGFGVSVFALKDTDQASPGKPVEGR